MGQLVGDTSGYNQPRQLRPRDKISPGGNSEVTATLPRLSVAECLDYTLTIDPYAALLGHIFQNVQDKAFAAAARFSPLDSQQLITTRERTVLARQSNSELGSRAPRQRPFRL
ncbi:MAG: hypothetical protein EBU88_09520 [Acidobacteria bacterium]|nr:hypothetical protein [Acidobacteriota bacterium]